MPPAGLLGVSLLSGAAVAGFGASLVIGGVSSFLQPRPRLSSSALGQGGGRVINIQQQAAPTRVIYGRQLVQFGAIVYADLTGANSEYVRIAGVWCNHTINAVEAVYFDGIPVDDGTLTFALGPYAPFVFMEVAYGTDDQSAFSQLTTDTGGLWGATDRCRGHAGAYIRLKFDPTIFPNGLPKIEFLLVGKQNYDPPTVVAITSGSNTTPVVITATGHGLVTDDQVRIAGTVVDGEYFVTQLTADTFELNGSTAAGAFTGGNFGKYQYSANGARIVNDYLTNRRFGLGMDFAGRVNEDAAIAATNLCGEQLTVPDYTASPVGTTAENRYEVNAVFETSASPGEILNLMMACLGGGGLPYISGQFHILPAAYRPPTLTLSEGDLIAPISYTSRRSRRETANTIAGTFISPERGWKETSFPEVTDAAALALDGEKLTQTISLPWVISQHAAQRIAWLALQKIRLQKPLSITTKLTGYAVQPGNGLALDVAALNAASPGWSPKIFEVQDLSLAQLSDANGQPVFGISHQLLENPAAIYDDFEDYQELPESEEPVNQNTVQTYIPLPETDPGDIPIGSNLFIDENGCLQVRHPDGSYTDFCEGGAVAAQNTSRFAAKDIVPTASPNTNLMILIQQAGDPRLFKIDTGLSGNDWNYGDGVANAEQPNVDVFSNYVFSNAVNIRGYGIALSPDGTQLVFAAISKTLDKYMVRSYNITTLDIVEVLDEANQIYRITAGIRREYTKTRKDSGTFSKATNFAFLLDQQSDAGCQDGYTTTVTYETYFGVWDVAIENNGQIYFLEQEMQFANTPDEMWEKIHLRRLDLGNIPPVFLGSWLRQVADKTAIRVRVLAGCSIWDGPNNRIMAFHQPSPVTTFPNIPCILETSGIGVSADSVATAHLIGFPTCTPVGGTTLLARPEQTLSVLIEDDVNTLFGSSGGDSHYVNNVRNNSDVRTAIWRSSVDLAYLCFRGQLTPTIFTITDGNAGDEDALSEGFSDESGFTLGSKSIAGDFAHDVFFLRSVIGDSPSTNNLHVSVLYYEVSPGRDPVTFANYKLRITQWAGGGVAFVADPNTGIEPI